MSIQATKKADRKWRGPLVIVAILVVIVIAGAWYLSGGFERDRNNNLRDTLSTSTTLDPQEKTQELCANDLCVEGWSTSSGNFLRFDSQGAAEQYATYLGDEGRRWKNIVLDMSGQDLTFEQKKEVIDTLFAQHDWS
ncbi:hypothetical protein [Glutamicibacter sp. ZJUTW]|uniref:hypothetical protein n=1 Tax=Glutamicibacter sp. ZJUTW TaxID=1155384 RepID=UPI0011F331E3|nr:hypothetical protein [Glutamicibacter sp. ZJUTW]QEP06841.1 hypothetical protein F0M17_06085 [Glutamicibacter sp. ZJUTW]